MVVASQLLQNKIRSRYIKALNLIPELVEIADVMHIYDNSAIPFRIFKKRKTEYYIWENENWNMETIKKLVGVDVFSGEM
jgi:predicted ABC-type ATPase